MRSNVFGIATSEAEGSMIEDGWISTADEMIIPGQGNDQPVGLFDGRCV